VSQTADGWVGGRGPRRVAVLVGALALTASGCGQTDFATAVGQTQATLNATITTVEEGAPQRAWFQFWPAATPRAKQRTAAQPVTATGPMSTTVTGLAADTTYAFRLCGRQGTVRACAQTRTFTTSHDSVQAVGTSETVHTAGVITQVRDLDVDVTSAVPASRAALVLDVRILPAQLTLPMGSRTQPNITCLAVSGHVARVGFRNPDFTPPPDQPYLGYGFATFFDGGPVGSGEDRVGASFGNSSSDPSVCTVPTDVSALLPLARGDISVNDASATSR
jgi:hypothetical protein